LTNRQCETTLGKPLSKTTGREESTVMVNSIPVVDSEAAARWPAAPRLFLI